MKTVCVDCTFCISLIALTNFYITSNIWLLLLYKCISRELNPNKLNSVSKDFHLIAKPTQIPLMLKFDISYGNTCVLRTILGAEELLSDFLQFTDYFHATEFPNYFSRPSDASRPWKRAEVFR